MLTKRILAILLCLSTLTVGTVAVTGCAVSVQAVDLMEGITPGNASEKATDDIFKRSAAEFAVNLFRQTRDDEKNSIISPLSVMLALTMTANGAKGETREQMERLLGGEIPLEALNSYLYSYTNGLPSEPKSRLSIANSIWFRDHNFTAEKPFLQTNADYYNAQAYKSPFNDRTVREINQWVSDNTDGMIDKLLDAIDPEIVMYLISAVLFDAEWKEIYSDTDIFDSIFTTHDGTKQTVSMMHSTERKYLDDGSATGFIKEYANGYSFAALLPNENVSLSDYVSSLTGEGLLSTLEQAEKAAVRVSLPKFSYQYEIDMRDALKSLGMTIAFDGVKADFSALGHSDDGNLSIGKVLHKARITVDEKGTKAGAVTSVAVDNETIGFEMRQVILNRPFVYIILDNATNLPIFIGTVTNPVG